MDYTPAEDVKQKAEDIIQKLGMQHIDMNRVHFVRSTGSRSRWVQARIYGMGRIWLHALDITPHYIIEVISERFDKLSDESKEKVIIHELLHIPRRFSGGLVCHRQGITRKRVEKLHEYMNTERARQLVV
jgi:predicted metallopeptidase